MATLVNEEHEKSLKEYREIISTLPKARGWLAEDLYKYQGFWFHPNRLEAIMWIQQNFNSRSTDVLLITTPKSGTTWLKALIFTIINRTKFSFSSHPLLTQNSHHCVPFFDISPIVPDIDHIQSPRIFGAHIALSLLPESVVRSGCKIVYICRNPKDVFVSWWHFMCKWRVVNKLSDFPIDEAFDSFCKGVSSCGPIWDHVLEFYKASIEDPTRVLFLKYEDVRREPVVHVKRLAEFLGQPFCGEEEEDGVVEEILKLCSFETMKSLEVNKSGAYEGEVKNDVFFRKGEVGDWKNHLSLEMIQRLDDITKEKFHGLDLTF